MPVVVTRSLSTDYHARPCTTKAPSLCHDSATNQIAIPLHRITTNPRPRHPAIVLPQQSPHQKPLCTYLYLHRRRQSKPIISNRYTHYTSQAERAIRRTISPQDNVLVARKSKQGPCICICCTASLTSSKHYPILVNERDHSASWLHRIRRLKTRL